VFELTSYLGLFAVSFGAATLLPDDQDALINAIAEVNATTVVVLQSGGPVTMPWLSRVPAVLAAWYPGSGGGAAISGVLFGRVNSSGRLPVTFPASESQLPRPTQIDPQTTTSNPGMPRIGSLIPIDYDIEGADVGHRWYNREGLKPLFPFGFGLSYTRFSFSGLQVSSQERLKVSVQVANVGDREGSTTVQLYVAKVGANGYAKRLAAFEKVQLSAGQSSTVELNLEPRILASYIETGNTGQFRISPGEYRVWAAEHALDERLSGDLTIEAFRDILALGDPAQYETLSD
jgi:beta-glucosidase